MVFQPIDEITPAKWVLFRGSPGMAALHAFEEPGLSLIAGSGLHQPVEDFVMLAFRAGLLNFG